MYWVNVFDGRWPQLDVINTLRKRSILMAQPQDQWKYEKYEYTGVNQYRKQSEGTICFHEMWDTEGTYFFTKEVAIPKTEELRDWYLVFAIGGECEVYIDEVPAGSLDTEHQEVLAAGQTKGGYIVSVKIQATRHAHDYVRSERGFGRKYGHHIFEDVQLLTREESLVEFADLITVLLQFMDADTLDAETKDKLHEIIKEVLYEIDLYANEEELIMQVAQAKEYLLEKIRNLQLQQPFGEVLFMGHSHLDLVFKWTYKETYRKVERTLSNTVRLMERHPETTYTQSQMQIIETLAQGYPELFSQVKDLVKQGRIEIVGDTYAEFDTNLPSGESLIRQFLYGKQIANKLTETDSKVCFLPDTFGYTGILPQILKQAGFQYFVTAKLSWNDTNQPEDLSFLWRGIDGSEIRTHLLDQYGGNPDPARLDVLRKDTRRKRMPHGEKMLCQYGAGDGGGGISEEMIHTIDCLKKIGELAEVKQTSLEQACDEIFADVNPKELPVREGELYFEKHRGVYTSQEKIKGGNRKLELALQSTEGLWTLYELQSGNRHDRRKADRLWKTLLFHQFHDIISGTCIHDAVEEAAAALEAGIAECEDIRKEIYKKITVGRTENTEETGKKSDVASAITLWNPTGVTGNTVTQIELPYPVRTLGGHPVQMVTETPCVGLVKVENIPAFGFVTLRTGEKMECVVPCREHFSDTLENSRYRILFDSQGEIISLYDKVQQREILRGKGNMLRAHVDRGGYFEAWDITEDIERKVYPVNQVEEMVLTEDGPVRKTLKITKQFRSSRITQWIHIYEDCPRIDFDTKADFQEKQMLLKAGFDVDVDAALATYDISMGNIQRETTRNDSFEKAKFEVLTHKYMDLSEDDHGIAILNDGKYGCDIKGNRMRITLIKTAGFPDESQDLGLHEFCYSLYPHKGNEKEAHVREEAYLLNQPLETIQGETTMISQPVICQEDGVMLETLKMAEDGTGVILRFYEHHGMNHEMNVQWKLPVKKAYRCDILERPTGEKLPMVGEGFLLTVKPYEIVTVKLTVE